MANEQHLRILKQGTDMWNRWRSENPEIVPDLSKASLMGADLKEANLFKANLREADLSETNLIGADLKLADLTKANLSRANLGEADLKWANLSMANLSMANLILAELIKAKLIEADLTEANLSGAELGGADFSGANLSGADLINADFRGAKLSGANLIGATVGWTLFARVDLREVKGLDKVHHYMPSIIGIDTIYLSQGEIPEVFLRRAGVPDDFIKYMRSLTGKAPQFYSCFISYSNKDRDFVERLYADLQSKGVRTWYFREDAKWGEPVWEEIDRGIEIYDKLVLVCSRNSLQSGPVLREIERALHREDQEHKNILFPITIDDYVFNEWEHPRKADVLAKVVGDFRAWNDPSSYQEAFKKLLENLQTESSNTSREQA